ncbi:MAG: flagellar basal body-associated FliL family protein [Alphaproteobacteria bacterium]|nr:flagellar basal body-associated FliL family protein [Alphaproteobacteria bacterium]
MAEENQNPEGNGDEGSEEKKGSSKILLIAILAVVLLGGAAGAAFFFISSGDDEAVALEAEAAAAAEAEAVVEEEPQAHFMEVPEILVNLASSGTASRYLKLKVNLEVGSEEDMMKLERVMPRVIDDFQVYLRQLRAEDLSASSGVYRLKEALLLRASQAAHPVKVTDVLFKEILVQ